MALFGLAIKAAPEFETENATKALIAHLLFTPG
jgi:hypothetical protein